MGITKYTPGQAPFIILWLVAIRTTKDYFGCKPRASAFAGNYLIMQCGARAMPAGPMTSKIYAPS